jgi:hypothetical protein
MMLMLCLFLGVCLCILSLRLGVYSLILHVSLVRSRLDLSMQAACLNFIMCLLLRWMATVFQAEIYAIMACFDYCLRQCLTSKTICICSDCCISVKLAHSVIEADASVLELYIGTFYS